MESSDASSFLAALLAEPCRHFAEAPAEQALVMARDEVMLRRQEADMPADGVKARLAF